MDDYLVLLGGPFVAFVIAKSMTSWKVQNGQLRKVNTDSSPTVAQVFQNDDGATSLVDAQYLVFNLVALVYFWVATIHGMSENGVKKGELPLLPPQLLALTGAAALTYATNKAIQNNRPAVTSIEPLSVRPGGAVRVHGSNSRPAGVTQADRVSATIEGVGSCRVTAQADDSLELLVPPGAPVGFRKSR